jgi:hypothetical protein
MIVLSSCASFGKNFLRVHSVLQTFRFLFFQQGIWRVSSKGSKSWEDWDISRRLLRGTREIFFSEIGCFIVLLASYACLSVLYRTPQRRLECCKCEAVMV